MIPFKDGTHWDYAAQRRLEHTVAFIDPADIEGKVVGNIGGRDRMFEEVLKAFGEKQKASLGVNSGEDWNKLAIWPRIEEPDTICCLEVLEHIMNPAWFLEGLRFEGTVLYLSTPVRNPIGLWCNKTGHFTEYDTDKVETLLRYTGWEPTKHETFRAYPWPESYLHGQGPIRGTARILTQRMQLWRAVAR